MPSILDHWTWIGSERLRPGTVMLAEGQKTDRIYLKQGPRSELQDIT